MLDTNNTSDTSVPSQIPPIFPHNYLMIPYNTPHESPTTLACLRILNDCPAHPVREW